jgi:hypothetical protein
MGYLVVGHVTRTAPDTARLTAALPATIAWSLHRDDSVSAYFIDTFNAAKPPQRPFTTMPPSKEISLEIGSDLSPLRLVYRALEGARLANSFKRGFLNLNLLLSKALQMSVCSFCSDDDGLDFFCESESGRLRRIHCECGDLEIVHRDGEVTVQPLLLEDGEPTDISHLHDPQGHITVLERNVDQSPALHRVVSNEVASFLGIEQPPLGLGSFDGMEKPLRRIAGS